jgi:hypothetical protein
MNVVTNGFIRDYRLKFPELREFLEYFKKSKVNACPISKAAGVQ